MTQAFNLSQLANNLNTSGQLDATDGLTGAVPVANGGTGQSSLTANAVLLGNGTSGVQAVAPSTSGNVLVSNGTTWVSQAPAGGGVTSLNGQTGAITNTGFNAIGSYTAGCLLIGSGTQATEGNTYAGSSIVQNIALTSSGTSGMLGFFSSALETSSLGKSGTWRIMNRLRNSTAQKGGYNAQPSLFVRIS